MTSIVKVDKIVPATGTTTTLGESGNTIQLGDGATAVGFGGEGGVPSDVKTFVNSGTWTKPAGCIAVIVEVQGAGAGGNNGLSSSPHITGGGGGGYARKVIDVSSISSATITVGAKGTGSATRTGNNGGDSVWSDGTNTLTAGGGNGSSGASNTGTQGGSATGGDVNIEGSVAASTIAQAGSSLFGDAGKTYAKNATGYGAGGSSDYAGTGGDGSDGVVIVTEYSGTSGSSGGGGSSSESPVKAWVNFNGTGTVAIRDSLNVSSITDLGVGYYTINFTIAMSNTDYAAHMSVSPAVPNNSNLPRTTVFANPNGSTSSSQPTYEAPTVNGFNVLFTINTMNQRVDAEAVCVMVTA
jgi:hypothetical protein